MSRKGESLSDRARDNIDKCLEKWDSRESWEQERHYGNEWSGGGKQAVYNTRKVVETYLKPFIPERPLDILEIAPGAGRFTAELAPLARRLIVVDLSAACIELCKERFRCYQHIEYHVNDGTSLDMIPDDSMDVIFSFGSFVHMDPEIIEAYVSQFNSKLRDFGVVWILHAARPEKSEWRSDFSKEKMASLAANHGFLVKAQIGYIVRSADDGLYWRDYISILKMIPPQPWPRAMELSLQRDEEMDRGHFFQQL